MKNLLEKLGALPEKVVVGLSILVTLVISTCLVMFVAWPNITSFGKLADNIKDADTKLSSINSSVAMLGKEDKKRLESLVVFLNQLVPEKVDNLHFATLNEQVSQAAGVSVVNIQISAGKAPAVKTPVTTAPGVSTSKDTKSKTPVQTSQVAAMSVAVTYSSNFDSLLTLLKFWSLADQLVAVKDINISGASEGILNYTISYELPSSPISQKATLDDRLSLTETQKKQIEDLKAKVIYTAT